MAIGQIAEDFLRGGIEVLERARRELDSFRKTCWPPSSRASRIVDHLDKVIKEAKDYQVQNKE